MSTRCIDASVSQGPWQAPVCAGQPQDLSCERRHLGSDSQTFTSPAQWQPWHTHTHICTQRTRSTHTPRHSSSAGLISVGPATKAPLQHGRHQEQCSIGATVNKLMGKALCLSFIGAPIDLYVVIRLTFQAFGSRPYSGKHVLVGVGPIFPSI